MPGARPRPDEGDSELERHSASPTTRLLGGDGDRTLRGLLGRASLSSLMVKLSGAGFLFLLHVLLARILGPEAYGDYAFAITWVGLLTTLCLLGLDGAALRFVAAYRGTARWSLLRGFVRRSLQGVALFSLLVAGSLALAIIVFGGAMRGDLRDALFLAALLLPVTGLFRQAGAILQGLKHVVWAEAPLAVARPLLLAGGVFLLWRLSEGVIGAPDVLILELVLATGVLAAYVVLLTRKLPRPGAEAGHLYRTRSWLSVGLPLLFISGAHVLIGRTDILMIGLFRGTADSGLYSAGVRVAWLTQVGLMAANMIVAPLIAELHAKSEPMALQRLLTTSARGTFAFSVVMALFLVAFGRPLLGLFGFSFREAYVPMILLALGNLFHVFFGSVGFLMTMTGHEREAARVVAGAALANVALNAALVPPFGLSGAAVATAVSLVGWNAVLLTRARRRLGIVPTVLGR